MAAGYVPSSPLSTLYSNTTAGTPASPDAVDGAVQAIVTTVNENYDAAVTINTGLSSHKNAAVLDHPDQSVTTAKIKDANVTTSKLADEAATTAKIAASAVTTVKIADAAVTTSKLADANVTTAKIADAAVTTVKLADSSVTGPKIAPASITASHIATGATSETINGARLDAVDEQLADTALTQQGMWSTNSTEIKYIAHRGLNSIAPENTLPAYEAAGKVGFWGFETDIQLTSDKVWVVMHDSTIDRTTDGTGTIASRTLSQVKTLNIDSGNKISNFTGTKVPTFEEYLICCRKWGAIPIIELSPVISISSSDYDLVLTLIKKHGFLGKCVIISFLTTSLNEIRSRNKNIILGYNVSTVDSTIIDYAKSLGNCFINTDISNLTKEQVETCHTNNLLVGVWTVSTATNLVKSLDYKVDFITTDNLIGGIRL